MQFIFAIALLLISAVLGALMAPKPPPPDTLGQFVFPTFSDGTPQAVIFGDVWLPTWMVLWYGNLSVESISSSGGKK
jgi:hypothetical protein